jgi:hypothetical protein
MARESEVTLSKPAPERGRQPPLVSTKGRRSPSPAMVFIRWAARPAAAKGHGGRAVRCPAGGTISRARPGWGMTAAGKNRPVTSLCDRVTPHVRGSPPRYGRLPRDGQASRLTRTWEAAGPKRRCSPEVRSYQRAHVPVLRRVAWTGQLSKQRPQWRHVFCRMPKGQCPSSMACWSTGGRTGSAADSCPV